jgi:2-alkyl-3-oxoalkanoate reductase
VSAPLRRVLVTGASGFLGSHLVSALLRDGVTICAQGRDESRLRFAAAVQTVRAPLSDLASLTAAARDCDAIVHAAALSAPWGARADFEEANVRGTANVIAAARAAGVRRLVHISSPTVLFDGCDQRLLTDAAPYPTHAINEYAQTKRVAEQLVRDASASMETVILRPKAIYGPGDRALVPRLLAAARRNRLPQIGDGANEVDVTHVDDVVRAVLCALTTQHGMGESFLITGGQHVPLWEMIRAVITGVGLRAPSRTISVGAAVAIARALEAVSAVTRREPMLTRYSVLALARTQTFDISRAQRMLGYAPEVGINAGLAGTIDALRRSEMRT